jgi:2-C-methyl-D-erythritol 2,4-cyclodiphosphate synthase
MSRVGIGYDVHRLAEGRKLILGGVEIPHTKGLEGHSDADVVLHALCDAIFGALGESDIGQFFPNTDARWKSAPSTLFLKEAGRHVKLHQGTIANIDITVIAEEPKVNPHTKEMKFRIAECLEINPNKIGLKATTNERIGFIGRGEGIAAMAVASIDIKED